MEYDIVIFEFYEEDVYAAYKTLLVFINNRACNGWRVKQIIKETVKPEPETLFKYRYDVLLERQKD